MINSNDLYKQILGIDQPWEISDVSVDIENLEVNVTLEYKSKTGACPECGLESYIYDNREKRKWRHLDSCQMKTILTSPVPRIKCKTHGVKTIEVPWAEKGSRFTILFEAYAITLLQFTINQTKVAELLRISYSQVHSIMEKSVNRGMERREKSQIEYAGIDEKSMKKGHKYFTVLSDLDENKVIDIVEDRTMAATKELFDKIQTMNDLSSLKGITMDMWKPYMSVSNEVFPEVDKIHDRFHLKKYLNEAVDKTRKTEAKILEKNNDKTLKNTKYLFLKNEENMTEKQKIKFKDIKDMTLETSKAWTYKDAFDKFFSITDYENAREYFYDWIKDAKESGLKYIVKVAEMFERHSVGILNYIRHKVTNSIPENLNGKIQLIKAISRGFKAFKNYRIAILFHLGKLDMLPQKI